jgi:proline iminopeptidase
MVQGLLDQVAPAAAAQRFHDAVAAPAKWLVWFPHSAHTPQRDEPDRFRELLVTMRDEWITAGTAT